MSIFNNDISFLIKLRAKPQILEIVKKKHLDEISDEISIQDKKNDLLIWNAMYTREIVENGILNEISSSNIQQILYFNPYP